MSINYWMTASRAVRPGSRAVGNLRPVAIVRYPQSQHLQPQAQQQQQQQPQQFFNAYSTASTATASSAASLNTEAGKFQFNRDLRQAYQQELGQFQELLTLSNQRSITGSQHLVDIQGALEIYNKLKELKIFSPADVAKLVQSIHASSRMSNSASLRGRVISNEKKKMLNDQKKLLMNFLEVIGQDISEERVHINPFGLMQFFSCYYTMKEPKSGLKWFDTLKETESPYLLDLISNAKVAGAVVELMTLNGSPLQDIEKIYMDCNEGQGVDINLEHTMIRAYLYFGRTTEALKIFADMIKFYNGAAENDYYFARVHDSFIGDCQDLTIAKKFFKEAVDGSVPYRTTVHPSSVHRLMERCWQYNQDFSELLSIWSDYLGLATERREREYNIVSYSLTIHFMERYNQCTDESYTKLKEIIAIYASKMPNMGVLFLNTLLTNVSEWKNLSVITEIIDSYDYYRIRKGYDTLRIILNAFRGLTDVPVSQIKDIWQQRLSLSRPLEIYDFLSLAKACEREGDESGAPSFFVDQVNSHISSGVLQESQLEIFESGLFRYINNPKNNFVNIRKALQA